MSIWMKYTYRDTFIHKLNSLTKFVLIFSCVGLCSLYLDVKYIIPFIVFGLVLAYFAKVPKSWFRFLGYLTIPVLPFNLLYSTAQADPALYRVIPPELVTKSLFSWYLPGIGQIGLTYGGMMWALGVSVRWVAVILFAFTFLYSTSFTDIINLLVRIGAPQPIVFIIAVTWKFLPTLFRNMNEVISAQRLRAWRVKSRNPVKLVKEAAPVANPTIRRAVGMAEEIEVAAKIRAFGSGKLTPVREFSFTFADYVISVAAILMFAIAFYALSVYNMGVL